MTWLQFSSDMSWVALLLLTLLLRKAVEEAVWLHGHLVDLGKQQRENYALPVGKKVRFSARVRDSGNVITDADLVGTPATLMLVVVDDAATNAYKANFLRTTSMFLRRSRGRLWIACKGSERICLDCMKPIQETLRNPRPVVIDELAGSVSSMFPLVPGLRIVNLDSDGCVLSYGELKSAL
jgi:hypothetical protein